MPSLSFLVRSMFEYRYPCRHQQDVPPSCLQGIMEPVLVFSIATVSVARIQYVWNAWMASKLCSSETVLPPGTAISVCKLLLQLGCF